METIPSATILIVDDEDRNRKLLAVFAQADGYSTVDAPDGRTAIALALAQQPDLILLDLMMPGMDGFEVVRSLKDNPLTREIPVVIVTSLDDIASRRRMLACGANDFVNKPVDRWELSLRMSKLIQARRDTSAPIPQASETDGGNNE